MLPGVLLLASLVGCDDSAPLEDAPTAVAVDPAAAIEVLDELTRAVAERDTAAAPWPSYLVTNAEAADVVDFSVRYLTDDSSVSQGLPGGQWAASVEVAWRFQGRDPHAAHAEVTVIFDGSGSDLRVAAFGGGARVQPLWLSGPVTVRARDNLLVMVAGNQQVKARSYEELGAVGLRQVEAALPGVRTSQGLVIEVPANGAELERVLNAEPGSYEAIAAVTTTTDSSDAPGSPVHVFVNDPVFAKLTAHGAQVVATHEIAHLVTGAATELGVPLWLVEGFADWVALRRSTVPDRVSAAQAIAQVKADGLPGSLPADEDFGSRTTHLGAAYEASWLLVRVLGERGGAAPLLELQRRLARGAELEVALRATFDLSVTELVELWRAELSRLIK